ncbi:MAG: hypothetical protein QOF83_3258, partial [Solirubrobacteraceae bacterium]|nr:hypothetical protein [Solirubrobacteraceae bacterium]
MSGQEHGKRDALEIENEALKAELTAVRAVLWDYWLASHDERCTENWPHAE